MSGAVRRVIIVIAASVLVLGTCAVVLGQTSQPWIVGVQYLGETPDTGSNWYQGSNASNLWDYVYQFISLDPENYPSPTNPTYGPTLFYIQTSVEPLFIYDEDGIAGNLGWYGWWDNSLEVPGSELDGLPGVTWQWYTPSPGQTPPTGIFHFSSDMPPAWRDWAARGTQYTRYNGEGETWSPAPEPASMALMGMCLVGVVAWKRRRVLKKD